jgi:hypothetical protein
MKVELLEKIIPPQTMRDVLDYVLISLFATVLLLFLLLIFHKLSIEFIERRRKHLRSKFSSLMRKYLLGRDGTVVRPRSKLGYEVLSAFCIEKLQFASQEDQDVIRQYLRDSTVRDFYCKMAESASMPKRFHAIKRLGNFSLEELNPFFKNNLLKEKSREVKGAIIWSISRIADASAVDLITRFLSTEISLSSKYNEYVYTNLIRSFKRKGIILNFLTFLDKLIADKSIPAFLKRDIIEACGTSRLNEASRLIVDFFFSSNGHPAVKIACMRALGKLECPQYSGVVTSALFHDDWRVRSQAAQAASACDGSAVQHLKNLLYDDYYYVRINAARSLSKMGEEGLSLLKSEINSDDHFVRDTARFMLRQ